MYSMKWKVGMVGEREGVEVIWLLGESGGRVNAKDGTLVITTVGGRV